MIDRTLLLEQQSLNHPLFDAITKNDHGEVVRLLDNAEADPSEMVSIGARDYSPLGWAASYRSEATASKRSPIMDALIGRGSNTAIGAPLLESRVPELTERLLQAGALPDQTLPDAATPLAYRCDELDIRNANLLLRNGADPTIKLQDGTPLIFFVCMKAAAEPAVEAVVFDLVRSIVGLGANIDATNARGETALAYAVALAKFDDAGDITGTFPNLVNFLLSQGADVGYRDRDAATVLLRAVLNLGSRIAPFPIIAQLFSHGGDAYVDAYNVKGHAPLHYLVHTPLTPHDRFAETQELIGTFLARGANVDHRDNNGETPLFRLVAYLCPRPGTVSSYPPPSPGTEGRRRAIAILQILIRQGADKKQKDLKGRTPADVARAARQMGTDILPYVN